MKISVIIPTSNRRDTLLRTLPTVFAQDLSKRDYEILVVVDGSTDGTIDALKEQAPDAKYHILQQPRLGPAAARNNALKAARGDWVIFLDDDILCSPDLLRKHLAAHEGNSRILVHGPIYVAPESPNSLVAQGTKLWYEQFYRRVLKDHGLRAPGEAYLVSNSSIRRSLLLDCGGFDEEMPSKEDSELGIRLWKMGVHFRFIPEATTNEIFVKSTSDFLQKDVRMWGRAEVAICRKHPDYRVHSPLARLQDGPTWKRFLRRAAMQLPGYSMLALTTAIRAMERFDRIPGSRHAGTRLMHLGHGIGFLRGAVEEAGSQETLQREFGQRLPVFIYHRVGPPRPGTYPDLTISPEELERHVRWLAKKGYVGIRPSDWIAWCHDGKTLPEKPILLTFDDAYEDTAWHGFPILKRYRFNAGVYAVTGEVGGTNSWDQAKGSSPLRLMTAAQIREWAAQGIEFGAHTRTHPDLTTLSEESLAKEVGGSAQDLAEILGCPVVSFAYPYGPYNQAVRKSAERHFKLAFCCDEGINTLSTDPFLLRRSMIWPRASLIDLEAKLLWGTSPTNNIRSRLRIRSRANGLLKRAFRGLK